MTVSNGYKPGSFWRICDRTGFTVRAENTKKQWNGLIVRKESWETRHPQDFVRGVRDQQAVPEPRPPKPEIYIQTTVLETESGLDGSAGYGPPLQTEDGGFIYTDSPPAPNEIAPVDPSKYPKSY